MNRPISLPQKMVFVNFPLFYGLKSFSATSNSKTHVSGPAGHSSAGDNRRQRLRTVGCKAEADLINSVVHSCLCLCLNPMPTLHTSPRHSPKSLSTDVSHSRPGLKYHSSRNRRLVERAVARPSQDKAAGRQTGRTSRLCGSRMTVVATSTPSWNDRRPQSIRSTANARRPAAEHRCSNRIFCLPEPVSNI